MLSATRFQLQTCLRCQRSLPFSVAVSRSLSSWYTLEHVVTARLSRGKNFCGTSWPSSGLISLWLFWKAVFFWQGWNLRTLLNLWVLCAKIWASLPLVVPASCVRLPVGIREVDSMFSMLLRWMRSCRPGHWGIMQGWWAHSLDGRSLVSCWGRSLNGLLRVCASYASLAACFCLCLQSLTAWKGWTEAQLLRAAQKQMSPVIAEGFVMAPARLGFIDLGNGHTFCF